MGHRTRFLNHPLTFRCIDCLGQKGVGDHNGAIVLGQIEAHLQNHPDHRLILSSERTGHHLNDIASDISTLVNLDALPFPNDAGKGHGGDLIHREEFDAITKSVDESILIEIPVGDQDV